MIKFLFKGILRDKNRSLLPVIVIVIGVTLSILLSGFLKGIMGDMIDQNARFETGHVKVMTRAYAKNIAQLPNDLALLGTEKLTGQLEKEFPEMEWVQRIRFGGLIDVPDESNETKAQGPVSGMAFELYSKKSGETQRLNLQRSLVKGTIPARPGQALLGNEFAKKLGLQIGDELTYFGSTMNGSLTFKNFTICGTVHFGTAAMDKGAMIVDIADARQMLDMEDGAAEILGYFARDIYNDGKATGISQEFNAKYAADEDEFAPEMQPLKAQNNLAGYLDYVDGFSSMFIAVFILAMSVILWNTGLLGGLRRYQEFGIRLALGESKRHIYTTLIYEAILIGFIGSLAGTILGIAGVVYLQAYGIDISRFLANSSMMMPSVMRAKFTGQLLYIGFIPGLFAMVLGAVLSGMGIYKRQTASLFKELEV